jgi:hypothetical protein
VKKKEKLTLILLHGILHLLPLIVLSGQKIFQKKLIKLSKVRKPQNNKRNNKKRLNQNQPLPLMMMIYSVNQHQLLKLQNQNLQFKLKLKKKNQLLNQ